MQYMSGIHALNTVCKLDTCGDWHASGIRWDNPLFLDSSESIWGNYGIESNKDIPYYKEGKFNVANHIRALLDLINLNKFSVAQGMNNDYICNEKYDQEIFEKVYELKSIKSQNDWDKIDHFMKKEYLSKWDRYKIKMEENDNAKQ